MIKDFKVSEVYKHLSIHDDADTLQVYVYEDDGKPAPISIQEEEFIQAPSPGMRIRDVSNFILNRRKGYFFLRASFLMDHVHTDIDMTSKMGLMNSLLIFG